MLAKNYKKGFLAVDVQNLYHSCIEQYGNKMKVDYQKLFNHTKSFVVSLWATAYIVSSGVEDNTRFIEYMKSVGYKTKVSQMKRYRSTSETDGTNWDLGISLDVIERVPDCDAIFIASGDGDYAEVLNRINPKTFIGIFAFRNSFNSKLLECADFVYFFRDEDVFKQKERRR